MALTVPSRIQLEPLLFQVVSPEMTVLQRIPYTNWPLNAPKEGDGVTRQERVYDITARKKEHYWTWRNKYHISEILHDPTLSGRFDIVASEMGNIQNNTSRFVIGKAIEAMQKLYPYFSLEYNSVNDVKLSLIWQGWSLIAFEIDYASIHFAIAVLKQRTIVTQRPSTTSVPITIPASAKNKTFSIFHATFGLCFRYGTWVYLAQTAVWSGWITLCNQMRVVACCK